MFEIEITREDLEEAARDLYIALRAVYDNVAVSPLVMDMAGDALKKWAPSIGLELYGYQPKL